MSEKIGHGSQMGSRHQDRLADWLSVVYYLQFQETVLFFINLIWRVSVFFSVSLNWVKNKTCKFTDDGQIGGFDTRWGEFLNLPNPSGRTRPTLGLKLNIKFTVIPTVIGSKDLKCIWSRREVFLHHYWITEFVPRKGAYHNSLIYNIIAAMTLFAKRSDRLEITFQAYKYGDIR
jgi:hypothetical protein